MKIPVRCTQAAALFTAALFVGCGGLARKESPLGLIVTPPSYYTTVRARYLGEKYQENLQRIVERVVQNSVTGKLQFANNIASVGGIGFFTHSAAKSFDERYLEVMLAAPDVFDGSVDFDSKVDRLLSQYGFELLSILASDSEIYKDKEVAGYGLNFSWRNTGQTPSGPRVTLERAVIYVTKADVHRFTSREVGQTELLGSAVIFALQEEGPARLVSYLPQVARGAARPSKKGSAEKGVEVKADLSPKIQEYDLAPQQEEKKSVPPAAKAPAREQPTKKEEEARRQEEASKRADEAKRQQEAKLAEMARQAEIDRQEEARKREEAARRQEETVREEEAKRVEVARLAEIAKQEELKRQQEARKQQEEAKRAEEAKRQEEARRQAEADSATAAKLAEVSKQEELKRQEEARKREEAARRQEETDRQEEAKRVEAARLAETARREQEAKKREEEAKRVEEVKRQEEAKKQTEARLAEVARQAELKRQEEARKREEAARRAGEARQQEEAKRQEEARQAETARLAEIARQEELKRREQESKRAEAAKKKEAEQLALKTKEEAAPFKSPLTKDSGPQSGVKGATQEVAKIEKPETSTATLKSSPPPSAPSVAPKQTGSSYVVQLSFAAKEEAKRWFDRLRHEGYSASMSIAGEGEAVRLRVGNFPSHGEASRVLGKLRGEGIKGIVIEAAN